MFFMSKVAKQAANMKAFFYAFTGSYIKEHVPCCVVLDKGTITMRTSVGAAYIYTQHTPNTNMSNEVQVSKF
jgi:hypothetical protein